jgi:hypothetical protein
MESEVKVVEVIQPQTEPCQSCRFYAGVVYEELNSGTGTHGVCHRFPPVRVPPFSEDTPETWENDPDINWAIPWVVDWKGCGEHQPRSA